MRAGVGEGYGGQRVEEGRRVGAPFIGKAGKQDMRSRFSLRGQKWGA